MNIWIVNPFDPLPRETPQLWRYASLAMLLTEERHNVTWWSSSFSHGFKKFRNKSLAKSTSSKNLHIRLIDVPPYRSNASIQRLYNHWIYAKNFEKEAMKALRLGSYPSPDVIIASSPPLRSARAAIRVARRLNAKTTIDIQDLWPETFQTLLPTRLRGVSKVLFYPLLRLEDANFRDCDGLSAVSRDYLDRALSTQKREKPAAVVHLGIDLAQFDMVARQSDKRLEKGPEDFWAVYIGSISHNYDLETIIRAASLVKQNNIQEIKFFIVGDGVLLPMLKRLSQSLNLNNVKFTGFLGPKDMIPILLAADAAINAIKEGTHSAFPNKVFDYYAAGLPIINSIAGGELERLIRGRNIGLQYTPGDPESLFKAIMELYKDDNMRQTMRANSRHLAETAFDRKPEYKKFLELIDRVMGKK